MESISSTCINEQELVVPQRQPFSILNLVIALLLFKRPTIDHLQQSFHH